MNLVWGPWWLWGALAFLIVCNVIGFASRAEREDADAEPYLTIRHSEEGEAPSAAFTVIGRGAEEIETEIHRITPEGDERMRHDEYPGFRGDFEGKIRFSEFGEGGEWRDQESISDGNITRSGSGVMLWTKGLGSPARRVARDFDRLRPGVRTVILQLDFGPLAADVPSSADLRALRRTPLKPGQTIVAVAIVWNPFPASKSPKAAVPFLKMAQKQVSSTPEVAFDFEGRDAEELTVRLLCIENGKETVLMERFVDRQPGEFAGEIRLGANPHSASTDYWLNVSVSRGPATINFKTEDAPVEGDSSKALVAKASLLEMRQGGERILVQHDFGGLDLVTVAESPRDLEEMTRDKKGKVIALAVSWQPRR